MRSIDENIEALSRTMLGDAKSEANQILAEAQAKAENIRKQAEDEAAAQRAQILDVARQEADRLSGQMIATTQMKNRTMELDHREKLLENVFTNAQQQLQDVRKRSDYDGIIRRLTSEGLIQLKTTAAIIHADPTAQNLLTKQVLSDLSKEFNTNLTMGEPLKQGTGVVLETEDGHLVYDNTLETRLSRLQNDLRPPVYRILIGETI